MSQTTSKDLKPCVESNVRPEDEALPLREKDSDGKKPCLNIPHSIAELIHKQILGVKTFGQFDHDLVRGWEVPILMDAGEVVNITRIRVDNFPDHDGNLGEYSESIIPRTFAMHGVGLDDLQLKHTVVAGGTCPGEVPVRESLGWIYSKLSTKLNELRIRLEINLFMSMPTSFEGWIEEARFWDNNTVGYSGADTQTTTASSKGTFVTIGEAGGKNGTKLECRTHNTNQHSWIDEVYKGLRAQEPATGTNEGKNEPNKSKKGLSDGFKESGDGKRSGKVS